MSLMLRTKFERPLVGAATTQTRLTRFLISSLFSEIPQQDRVTLANMFVSLASRRATNFVSSG